MIPAQRRALILERIQKEGAASIVDLGAALGISASTVRRDLDYLMQQGYLERTHGGALVRRLLRPTFEPHTEISSHIAHTAKVAIGGLAAELVTDGQSIIFDSSSTVREAARAIVRRQRSITAVTNDLSIATELAGSPQIQLIVVGGSLRPQSMTLVGDPGASFLSGLHVDLAFLGIHAITNGILSETSIEVAAIKRQMAASAAKRVLLADASKFTERSFCRVGELQSIDILISDSSASQHYIDEVRALGIDVRIANPLVEDASVVPGDADE